MGYDCGFDMVPRLEDTSSNATKWKIMIDAVRQMFIHDPVMVTRDGYLEFEVGEYPLLPFEGHKFLRFSSKVSGSITYKAQPYIEAVYKIAEREFGERIQFWHEGVEVYGHYDWEEVDKSIASFQSDKKVVTTSGRLCFSCDGQ
jgi:hypothetical protein